MNRFIFTDLDIPSKYKYLLFFLRLLKMEQKVILYWNLGSQPARAVKALL